MLWYCTRMGGRYRWRRRSRVVALITKTSLFFKKGLYVFFPHRAVPGSGLMSTRTEGTLFVSRGTFSVMVLTSTVAAKGIWGWAFIGIVPIKETPITLHNGNGVLSMDILLGDIEPKYFYSIFQKFIDICKSA